MIHNEQIIPALAFMTLGIVIVFAIIHFFSMMKQRRMREQTSLTRHSEDTRSREGSIIKE